MFEFIFISAIFLLVIYSTILTSVLMNKKYYSGKIITKYTRNSRYYFVVVYINDSMEPGSRTIEVTVPVFNKFKEEDHITI
jgi:hypothetical protein